MNERKIRYILAEDEPPIRQNLIKKIRKLAPDFELAGEASGGKTALEMIREHHPEILFTDIRMPGLNGLELIETLRNQFPEMLTVIISGYDDFNYAQQSIRLDVADYLLKPIDQEQLETSLIKLRKILKQKDAEVDKNIDWYEETAGKDLASGAAAVIQSRFREDLSIQELADDLKVNPTYLSRTFKEQYGMTPSRYIQKCRMDLARRLLIQYPRMEVKEISAFTGYSDQNYFSRVFKKETGLSPLEYRNKDGLPSE